MAVTITTVINEPYAKTFDIIATADADTTASILHGFSVAPKFVVLVPRLAAARISLWIQTTITVTTITVLKATTMGSGDAGVQLTVIALRDFPTLHP